VAEFPRTARLAADVVLGELARTAGVDLDYDGPCSGGQVGAAYVRWPDGHRSVLTCQPAGNGALARRQEEIVAVAKAAGVPAPSYELVAELPSAVAIVQELLPGARPAPIGWRTVESMVEVNHRCRGLLAGRADVPAPSLFLQSDGPGFCLHEPLARYGRRTARLLGAIEAAGAAVPRDLDGSDVVHFDYHPENVLTDEAGTVTGVVDWDGANRGDGRADLYTLRFDLARRSPALGSRLAAMLAPALPAELELACWAHLSLRYVDWAIRHLTSADVTAWLEVAEKLMP
jgi:Phosphotransferase enzyme family